VSRLVVIQYKKVGDHDIYGKRFKWVSESIKASFCASFCKEVNLTVDKFEIVIRIEWIDFIVRSMEYFQYKHMDSDIFEYMLAFEADKCRWYNEQDNTSLDY